MIMARRDMLRAVTSRTPWKNRRISARLRSGSNCESVNRTSSELCSGFSHDRGRSRGNSAGLSSVTSTSRKRTARAFISSTNSNRPSFKYPMCVAKLSISARSWEASSTGGFGRAVHYCFDELLAHKDVETAEGFIENDQARTVGERGSKRRLDAHSARKVL